MATYGWGDGHIVPTDGQVIAQTHEGRMAIKSDGTPELVEALAELSRAGQGLVHRHQAEALPRAWGSLLKAPEGRRRKAVGTWSEELFSKMSDERVFGEGDRQRVKVRSDQDKAMRYTHRIPWVLEGPTPEKPAVLATAKAVCVATGGQVVLVMIRIPRPRRRQLEIAKKPDVEIGYKAMLVVPRPVRVKSKNNGRTYLDWRPVVVEPPKGAAKTYRVSVIETFVEKSSDPDDYRVDQSYEIQKLTRIADDLAKSLRKQTERWLDAFRVDTAGRWGDQRGFEITGNTLGWLWSAIAMAATGAFFALHGLHF